MSLPVLYLCPELFYLVVLDIVGVEGLLDAGPGTKSDGTDRPDLPAINILVSENYRGIQ